MTEEETVPGEAPPAAAEAPPAPDYRDLYLRALAELDNFRKRSEKDRAALVLTAAEGVVRRLLEPLDSFDRAVGDLTRLKAEAPAALQPAVARSLDGLRALQRQFNDALVAEGLAPIKAEGEEFDPAKHEALLQLPHPTAPAGTVVEVLRPGYTLRGRLLRPASVAVSAGPAPDPGAAPAADPDAHASAPPKGAQAAKKL